MPQQAEEPDVTEHNPLVSPGTIHGLSSVTLASVLDQSVDCVKLIGLDGTLQYMNGNGLCAMEIDDFCAVEGKNWTDLWPTAARQQITESYDSASAGQTARFRAFCPTAKGVPRWWDVSVSAVSAEDGAHVGYLSVSRDVTESETSREALEVAADELKHRLGNTYATISSLITGFARGHAGNEEFAADMQQRLVALARAQLLFVTRDAPCDIARLVPALLVPFDNPSCPVTIGDMASARVDQGQADAIALVVGELAVNSSKHGALLHGGTITVSSLGQDGATMIEWREQSDVAVQGHDREGGQGLVLMRRIVAARRGTIDLAWHDFGLTVRLAFQAKEPVGPAAIGGRDTVSSV